MKLGLQDRSLEGRNLLEKWQFATDLGFDGIELRGGAEFADRLDELARARELADQFARQPPLVLRYTREAITLELKRRFRDELPYGLALEGLASGYGNWR